MFNFWTTVTSRIQRAVQEVVRAPVGFQHQMTNENLQKAKILDATNGRSLVACKFNPTQLVLNKANKWKATEAADKNVGPMTFSGGSAATLTLDLFFDTTDTGEDVRTEYLNKIVDAMMYKGGNPPKVKFVWGRIVSFDAYITKISQAFTLFLQDGTPVRATAKVTFQQATDDTIIPLQNPTSRSAPRRLWTVTAGETLDWIAYMEYGDAEAWRHIAEANQLSNPRDLRAGQVLLLPPLP